MTAASAGAKHDSSRVNLPLAARLWFIFRFILPGRLCVCVFFCFFSILASATLHVAATAERSLANGKTSRLVWIHLIWSERSSAHLAFLCEP